MSPVSSEMALLLNLCEGLCVCVFVYVWLFEQLGFHTWKQKQAVLCQFSVIVLFIYLFLVLIRFQVLLSVFTQGGVLQAVQSSDYPLKFK